MGEQFGERLALLIKEKGLSQRELAQKAGVTEAAMSLYVKGTRIPRASVLARVAEALNTTSDYLMNGTASNNREELDLAKKLLARNVAEMTHAEKMQIISILFSED